MFTNRSSTTQNIEPSESQHSLTLHTPNNNTAHTQMKKLIHGHCEIFLATGNVRMSTVRSSGDQILHLRQTKPKQRKAQR